MRAGSGTKMREDLPGIFIWPVVNDEAEEIHGGIFDRLGCKKVVHWRVNNVNGTDAICKFRLKSTTHLAAGPALFLLLPDPFHPTPQWIKFQDKKIELVHEDNSSPFLQRQSLAQGPV